MAITQETKAQAVAEYWLKGSYRRAARIHGLDNTSVARWVAQAEAPQTATHKKVRARALVLFEARQVKATEAFNRALQLQMEDLPGADFRDRTGFLKIIGELGLVMPGGGRMPSPAGQGSENLDAEIRQLLSEMAQRERNGGSH